MRATVMIGAIALAACHGSATKQGTPDTAPSAAAPAIAPLAPTGGFAPLQSSAVKDAIHRALVSGEAQRWQDGSWSGYAVPSRDTLANGCRTIRYTIDQQPDAPPATINACDASRAASPSTP